MERIYRDFNLRSEEEKDWIIQNTWCSKCNKSDIGLNNPVEYQENGKIYISGKCIDCGQNILTEIVEDNKNCW